MVKNKNIILGVTGSVAIYKACDLVRRLKEEGFAVSVIMTKEAEEFIRPVLFQSLSGNRVYRGMFSEPDSWEIEHIALADKAGLVLIAPATANIIAKIACGLCDDLLSCVVSATRARVVLCPAMNEGMYKNRVAQANIKKLEALGYTFIGPKRGRLACGKVGLGCLAGVEEIVKKVKAMAT